MPRDLFVHNYLVGSIELCPIGEVCLCGICDMVWMEAVGEYYDPSDNSIWSHVGVWCIFVLVEGREYGFVDPIDFAVYCFLTRHECWISLKNVQGILGCRRRRLYEFGTLQKMFRGLSLFERTINKNFEHRKAFR